MLLLMELLREKNRSMKKIRLFLFLSFIFSTSHAFAYESMIRHGYFSCVACHNSTSGGGSLNEYGKVIAHSFSAFQLKQWKEEAEQSQKAKIDLSSQIRLARINRKGSVRNFAMQLDLLAALELSPKSHISATIAKAPSFGSKKLPLQDEVYLRKLLYTYRIKENLFWEFGRNSPPFGIYDTDHTTYIRAFNRRGTLDLPLQSSLSLYQEKK